MNQTPTDPRPSEILLECSAKLLAGIVWVSASLFGFYILAFYVGSLLQGDANQWNKVLPGLFTPDSPTATASMGIHFIAGAIILLLGCVQLIESLRRRAPRVHRWLGRVYVISALLTTIGGIGFILLKGTVGGMVMDIGFTGYGILMLIAALATIRYARAGDFERHRAWAIRLFALAIGSWLYRMYYGFWFLMAQGAGHSGDFTGLFDQVMAFFFYLPNLAVAELYLSRYTRLKSPAARIAASGGLFLISLFLLIGTYYFTKQIWGPAILQIFSG